MTKKHLDWNDDDDGSESSIWLIQGPLSSSSKTEAGLGLGLAGKCRRTIGAEAHVRRHFKVSTKTINEDTPQWENPTLIKHLSKNNLLQCHINRKRRLKP
eukprot:TRINITY_DN13998_c0_g1_i2.p1 TRINITY_DN13998_c0_g1~~TRINITY_DN13998_c0_g1_i2.p1  ORF type:complete len:100 (+),score=8.57 TRINITY_DN13998_c0_g1_i2:291-590(+)